MKLSSNLIKLPLSSKKIKFLPSKTNSGSKRSKFSILENLNLESLFTSLLKSSIAKLFRSLLDLFEKFFSISIIKFGLNSFFLTDFFSKIFETFFASFSIFFSSVQMPDFVSKEQFDKKKK